MNGNDNTKNLIQMAPGSQNRVTGLDRPREPDVAPVLPDQLPGMEQQQRPERSRQHHGEVRRPFPELRIARALEHRQAVWEAQHLRHESEQRYDFAQLIGQVGDSRVYLLRDGQLEQREVEVEVSQQASPMLEVMTPQGSPEGMENFTEMLRDVRADLLAGRQLPRCAQRRREARRDPPRRAVDVPP